MSGQIDARKPRPLPAGTVCLIFPAYAVSLIPVQHGRGNPAVDGLAAGVLPGQDDHSAAWTP
jgi:hypothetical protein